MHNSTTLPPEQDYFANFMVRLKTAYRVLIAKQAIVIVDNELDIFNMDKMQVLCITSQIVGDMSAILFEDIEQDVAIHNLVYN